MRFSFCKKSVFCILFLLFFALGTICGVLFLRCLLTEDVTWLRSYCAELDHSNRSGVLLTLWFLLLPFLGAFAVGLTPFKDKLFPALFFLRGCFCVYAVGAFYTLGIPLTGILLRNLVLLPIFYAVCRELWFL